MKLKDKEKIMALYQNNELSLVSSRLSAIDQKAPTGRHIPAQGEALGTRYTTIK